ncbi:MAG: F0F1 ATP synthase subunit alpha [Patescibacteria group bacterium]
MADITATIARELSRKIASFEPGMQARRVGSIISVADGVARISGLPHAGYMERLEFANGISAVAINLEEDAIGAIILGDYLKLRQGDEVRSTGELLSMPVGESFLGRVVTPLGEPLDGGGPLPRGILYPMEKVAPGVTERRSVSTPLQTGIKAIDAMIPVGRGQRELIIGDRNTGKTALIVDTIINQKKENVLCVYVAIGQKMSRIAHIISDLSRAGAMSYTIVVVAGSSDPAAYQYLAPYAGTALAEYFMDKGGDVLIAYDDLSKHAWAYRQISLILRRPSGREAYPGDVFYLHSRLLERACRLGEKHGGGSITALPVIETQANDIAGYIPTNVISITDGQIFLEPDLFYAGQRPAVNVGVSVSRVGGAAQVKAMKKVSGNLKLDLAQYRALAAFAQFSTDLDATTKKQIDRGSRMMELLKQDQFQPMPVEHQVAVIWAGSSGHLDDVAVSQIRAFEREFLSYLDRGYKKTLTAIAKEKVMSEASEKELIEAIGDFKKTFSKT